MSAPGDGAFNEAALAGALLDASIESGIELVTQLQTKFLEVATSGTADEIDAAKAALEQARCSASADLLNDVRGFTGRFCVFPDEHCLTAITLWAAHAHMVEHFHTTPRLALLSPEPASGKTRVLEVLNLLTPNSMLALSPSPATIFRKLAKEQITLLLDETDAIFKTRGKDDTNEELRALLNAGYKRGAKIPRCVGLKHDVVDFDVFAAVALAGLGDLPDTIMSRSIIIRMRRRAPNEDVEPFRTRVHEPEGHKLRERLAQWANRVGAAAGSMWPQLPAGIVDRPAEAWEPLIAVADMAGGPWPKLARDACVHLCKVALDRRASLGVRLLADLRTIFGDAIVLPTAVILDRLHHGDQSGLDDDAPWSDIRGQPLGDRGLASMLSQYGVKVTKVKYGGKSLKGYRREHLHDAWVRYLPPLVSPGKGEPGEPRELASNGAALEVPHRVPEVPQSGQQVPFTGLAEPSNDAASSPGSSSSSLAGDGGRGCPACGGEGDCQWCSP